MTEIRRIVLHELRERSGTTSEVAQVCALSESDVLDQLGNLNERVKPLLRQTNDPITANRAGAWRADGVAGLLRLNRQVELEVVPKFLDQEDKTWRRDFFLLALLVRTGHLLHYDEISADSADRGDLATLVARSLLRMCEENRRRPIRRYERVQRAEFGLDGDVEWESVILPEPDGFLVSSLTLTRRNAFNATIKAAADVLAAEVTDTDTVAGLSRLSKNLGEQSAPPEQFPALPQRHIKWEGAYSLARLVIEGLGLDLAGGGFTGPGFILSTWQSWEQLCFEVVRRALPSHRVVDQKPWKLGERAGEDVFAYPDITPYTGEKTDFLLDAKYKTPQGKSPIVDRADVNEAITFLHASGRSKIDLLYPSEKSPDELPLGQWSVFDTLEIRNTGWVVRGIELQIQGIARRGGFDQVVDTARAALRTRTVRVAAARDLE